MDKNLIPSIKEYVHEVSKNDQRIQINWKNNNFEAMDHILKLNLNWKPSKIPNTHALHGNFTARGSHSRRVICSR